MLITRDSAIWWFGMIAAIVMGVATLGNIQDYGIPNDWLPYIRLAALVIGIISGKLATSPLKGDPYTGPDRRAPEQAPEEPPK